MKVRSVFIMVKPEVEVVRIGSSGVFTSSCDPDRDWCYGDCSVVSPSCQAVCLGNTEECYDWT